MRGFPKYINTAHDVAVCEEMFPEALANHKAALEENKYAWVTTATLAAKDADKAVTDATHKAETQPDGKIIQMELKVDTNSPAYKLGLVKAAEEEEKPVEEGETSG